MDLSEPAQSLQSDIRKLQLELMRQELNDKMLTLKLYLERKKSQNTTTQSTTTIDPSSKFEMKPFNSILFVNVIGEFEVWHFVLLILFVWFIMLVLIKYCNKFVNIQRAKRRRRNSIKLKKELKRKQRINSKKKDQLKESLVNKSFFQQDNVVATPSLENNDNLTSLDASCDLNNSTVELIQNKSIEYFMPPKKDFFLYTIHEHEIQAKKTFTFKKKQPEMMFESNLKIINESSFSKSDSNLSKNYLM